MSNENDLALQGALASIHPLFETCTLQIQRRGLDLVLRVRFPQLMKKSPNGMKHFVTTEVRYQGGMAATNEEIQNWVEDAAADSLVLAHAECKRRSVTWPRGWPILAYELKQETKPERQMRNLSGLNPTVN